MGVKQLVPKVEDWDCGRISGPKDALKWALINEASSDVIYLDAESPIAALLEALEKLGWALYLSTDGD